MYAAGFACDPPVDGLHRGDKYKNVIL
jgi:hypothetical protein